MPTKEDLKKAEIQLQLGFKCFNERKFNEAVGWFEKSITLGNNTNSQYMLG